MNFYLSTSQTPTQLIKDENWKLEKCNCVGGFSTVSDTGYGVSYIPFGENSGKFPVIIHSLFVCSIYFYSQ